MDRATQVVQIIEKNPGIQFSEIMRESGMKNGSLATIQESLKREEQYKSKERHELPDFIHLE
jgi:hypothetical protein